MDNVFNLGEKKNWKGAIAFYLAFFIIPVSILFIVGAIVGIIGGEENIESSTEVALKLGQISAIVYTFVVGALILKQKGLTKQFGSIALVLFATLLSIFAGLLLGLIPLAFLTTRSSQTESTADAPAEPSPAEAE